MTSTELPRTRPVSDFRGIEVSTLTAPTTAHLTNAGGGEPYKLLVKAYLDPDDERKGSESVDEREWCDQSINDTGLELYFYAGGLDGTVADFVLAHPKLPVVTERDSGSDQDVECPHKVLASFVWAGCDGDLMSEDDTICVDSNGSPIVRLFTAGIQSRGGRFFPDTHIKAGMRLAGVEILDWGRVSKLDFVLPRALGVQDVGAGPLQDLWRLLVERLLNVYLYM